MNSVFTVRPRDPAQFPHWSFDHIAFEYEPQSQSVWMYYRDEAPPYYSFEILSDIADLQESLRRLFASPHIAEFPVRYFVMASRKRGVFNLGGDLAMFADSIRKQDRDTLRTYAHACIQLVHGLATAFGLPLVTVSVITGQALGGGFEGALAEDFLFADETARIGVPEVAFNTFPGMGAVTLLSRRLGMASAEEIIAGGKVYTAAEMFDLGVVDVLCPAGETRSVTLSWMHDGDFPRRLAMAQMRRRLFPVAYSELEQITNLWVDCSCDVLPQDIRHMERLAAAQKKMFK
jgi:DSF synthase